MRKRDNSKFYITMILGAVAIFFAHSHVNASELSVLSKPRANTRACSLFKGCSKCPPRRALSMPKLQMNQAADLSKNLRSLFVASK